MKKLLPYLFILATGLYLVACSDDDPGVDSSTVTLSFSNEIGGERIVISEDGVTQYPYTNSVQQTFNIVKFRYYISKVKLIRSNGVAFEVPVSVGPRAEDIEGIFLIDEKAGPIPTIDLADVPIDTYTSIEFLVGVDSTGVEEGAAGGILDPASDDGWFWNWNAGYVALAIEGQSPSATGDESARTLRPGNPAGFGFHVGGWKEVPGSAFVYNNQQVSLTFDQPLDLNEPTQVNLTFDIINLLSTIDFTENSALHKPIDGSIVAEKIPGSFEISSVNVIE